MHFSGQKFGKLKGEGKFVSGNLDGLKTAKNSI